MTIDATQQRVQAHPIVFLAAFGTGGLLSLMVHFNGELAHYGNAVFSAWVAHGTGTIAAVILLTVLYRHRSPIAEGPACACMGLSRRRLRRCNGHIGLHSREHAGRAFRHIGTRPGRTGDL